MGLYIRARVELHATDTGDLVFMYCIQQKPSSDFVPLMCASMPLEYATSLRQDVKGLFGNGTVYSTASIYGMELTSQVAKAFLGKRPIAIVYVADPEEDRPSTEVINIECIDDRWEYYCNGKEE